MKPLCELPVAVNGISLCLSGLGLLLRVFVPLYSRGGHANELIYILLSASMALTLLYLAKCSIYTKVAYANDWRLPIQIGAIGSLSINFYIQGTLLNEPAGLSALSLYWMLCATVFVALVNCVFLRSCWINSVPPEPIYNTCFFSCFFIPALLPTNNFYCIVIRDAFFVYGLVAAIFIVPTSIFRLLFLHDNDGLPLVAKNPTCGIQQAVLSIAFSAWMLHPLSFANVSIVDNRNVEVIHLFFALSQFGFIVSLISIWQRRSILRSLGPHPSWAACTFPFVNTAIAVCNYRKNFPTIGAWLDVLVFFEVILAMFLCAIITAMYFHQRLFLFPHEKKLPVSEGEGAVQMSNVSNRTYKEVEVRREDGSIDIEMIIDSELSADSSKTSILHCE